MSEAERKTVLITGASSGIGKVTCLYLAERGYAVIGTSRSIARLSELQRLASEKALPITAVELDINSDEAVDRALPELRDNHGPIDALVNNAGYILWGPLETLPIAEIKALFETNFFAAARLIKGVLPGMVERRQGTIVNISSIAGRFATPLTGAYAASKFALEGLSEALRTELWPLGIRVAVVEPGLLRTNLHESQVEFDEELNKVPAYIPYVDNYRARHARYFRLAGDPVKVAKVIHKIVRSRRPAFRHPVGPEARLGMLGARLLPERVFQALLSRFTIG